MHSLACDTIKLREVPNSLIYQVEVATHSMAELIALGMVKTIKMQYIYIYIYIYQWIIRSQVLIIIIIIITTIIIIWMQYRD